MKVEMFLRNVLLTVRICAGNWH